MIWYLPKYARIRKCGHMGTDFLIYMRHSGTMDDIAYLALGATIVLLSIFAFTGIKIELLILW
jgi:hypothetical protein